MNRRIKSFCLPTLLLHLILLSNDLLAQADSIPYTAVKESYRAYFGLSIGPSFPFGPFKESDINLIEGGYAQRGIAFNLDFSYRFYKNMIVSAQYSRMSNGYDDKGLLENGSSICPNCSPPLTFTSANASDYELNAFMLGYGIIKEHPNYSFQIQFMVGQARMYTPRIELDYIGGILDLDPLDETDIVYSLNSSLRIRLNDQLDFHTVGNFFVYQARLDRTYTFGSNRFVETTNLRYQVFNLTFGLAYRIIKKEDEDENKLRY